ncbi:MAG: hypothetical protein M5R40_27650 [Anaerolineae bacterium]|nr:hypothetical protein [Anaerolineae bacterium]
MIEQCPVCGGRLTVEKKSRGLLGRGRRVVRCDTCSSVLRERGRDRWHYAIDITRSPEIYRRFNGKYLTEAELEALRVAPPAAEARPADVTPAAGEEAPLDVAPLEPALTDVEAAGVTEAEAGNGEPEAPAEDAIDAPAPAAEETAPEAPDAPAVEPEPEPDAASAPAEPPPAPEPASPERAPESEGAPPEAGSFEAPRFIEDEDWHGF